MLCLFIFCLLKKNNLPSCECPGDDTITRTSQLNVGTAADVSLKIAETDLSSLSASIRAPSGNEEPCLLKKLPNRHLGED